MDWMRRSAAALMIGLGLAGTWVAPAEAQDVPTGAGRVIEKVEFRVLVARVQLDVQVGRILENNDHAVPGK